MNKIDIDNLTEDERRYDDMLLSILQREGKIEPFLDVVFKFLYRRQVYCKISYFLYQTLFVLIILI